ncbi:MAG: nucleotidyltransferase domain-containing protein [Candidatus Hatepunaea meridiana]|nr:nucleotidyltransferase domain-containing protein [Candidatus Hatepunaea meridiana]
MTDNTNVQARIRAIANRIAEEYKPEKIILFGSYAWGTPGSDSDIDLFIVKDTDDRFIDRSVAVHRIIHDLRRYLSLDIIVITPNELEKQTTKGNQFLDSIVNEGKVLYGR